jgi:hypothetical protein
MMEVPADTPLTAPDALTVAAEVLLVHVPPDGVLPSVVVEPTHTAAAPLIAVGPALTVITAVLKQLAPTMNVIVVVPALTPVTTPVLISTVALAVLLLLHVPLPALLSAVVAPIHTLVVPEIEPTDELTVTSVTA